MKINFQKLQIAMASACMNKGELAAASGLSRVSITKYFSGERHSSTKTIGKIAKALEVPVTDIIEDSEDDEHKFQKVGKGGRKMNEDKQLICTLLLMACKATRGASDLISLEYDEGKEMVTATFASGGKRRINVAMDSGTAMIRDIMSGLGC